MDSPAAGAVALMDASYFCALFDAVGTRAGVLGSGIRLKDATRALGPRVRVVLLSPTSWAGQEALSGTISQYHAQFLEFGPDILTRDLKQAQQHIESRMQKNKKKSPPMAGPKFLLELEVGKSASIFFFFFCIRLPLFF